MSITTYHGNPKGQDSVSEGEFVSTTGKSYKVIDGIAKNQTNVTLKEIDDVYQYRNNTFYVPKIEETYGVIQQGKLWIQIPPNVIITESVLDYIRKPRRISLALNNACELSGTAPRRIVDLAVERIKLETDNFQAAEQLQRSQQLRENH